MSTTTIATAVAADRQELIALLLLAFSADPIERWMYPDPRAYLLHFPDFLKAFTAKTFESKQAYFVGGYKGAALWLPPHVQLDDEPIVASLEQTLDQSKQADTFALLEQMGSYHPSEPHWYLAIMGVDPAQQGQGFGSMLLKHTLAAIDHDHAPVYLESTNPRNISLYERHGFELLGKIQAGASPAMFPMLRKPR